MLIATGMLCGSIASVVALSLLLGKIPAGRSVAKFVALYLRMIFAAYILVWVTILYLEIT
jgi:hypothetical protein